MTQTHEGRLCGTYLTPNTAFEKNGSTVEILAKAGSWKDPR